MVTIWDVAARAGVSKSTVSLVLNNSPLVKEETRQKVLAAIRALNYVPNYNARSLVKRSSSNIGIIHSVRSDRSRKPRYEWDYGLEQFSHDIEDGIFESIMERDSDLGLIKEHFDFSSGGQALPKILQTRRVDGAIFIGSFSDEDVAGVIRGVEVPVVVITSSAVLENVDTVFHDPEAGSYLAARKLMETGHRRICLLNCPRSFHVWPRRIEGMRRAARDCGYALDRELLISAEKNTAQEAYRAFSHLLDAGRRPDAVHTANVELALGVLRCLYERRLRVPEDISIISYEDSGLCGNITPALSAVNIEKEAIGRMALRLLLERINDPSLPARSVVIEPHLVLRSSVADRRSG